MPRLTTLLLALLFAGCAGATSSSNPMDQPGSDAPVLCVNNTGVDALAIYVVGRGARLATVSAGQQEKMRFPFHTTSVRLRAEPVSGGREVVSTRFDPLTASSWEWTLTGSRPVDRLGIEPGRCGG